MSHPADDAIARSAPPPAGFMGRLDGWMAQSPWHPRITPFLAYVLLLPLVQFGTDQWLGAYPILYTLQCGLVVWLVWRYRRLVPELNLRFHWLVIPVGVGVCVAWIALGLWLSEAVPAWQPGQEPDTLQKMLEAAPVLAWLSLGLRLVGMSLVVPLLEEPFVRSLLLRGTARAKPTGYAVVQFLQDMPLIGDWLMRTELARRADQHPEVLTREFHRHPLGTLTLFGVVVSTAVFTSYHVPRDWAACLVCGVAYCLLVGLTGRRHGLGPVIWAHGLTNALLWGYTVYSGDWRFL